MTKLITAGLVAILVALEVQAAPATPGTLSDYLALGSGGATIDSTLFSDFSLLPNQMGATPISPATVQVTPIGFGSGNPGFVFTLNQNAAASDLFELKFEYKISDVSITAASVSIEGASTTGDGAVTSILDGIPGNPPLIAFSTLGIEEPLVQASFPAASMLTVQFDAVVDGGLAGEASLQSTTNRFTVGAPSSVPEAGSSLLSLLLGVCGLGIFGHWCRARSVANVSAPLAESLSPAPASPRHA